MTAAGSWGMDLAAQGDVQVVRIGDATLYLGDAYRILPSLGWFDVIVADPPYLFETSGGGHFRKERGHTDRIAEEQLDKGFDVTIVNALMCGGVVLFCHNDQLPELTTFLKGSFERFVVCQWHKSNPMPVANKHYRPDTEFYIHAWNRDFPPHGALADKGRFITTPVGKSAFDHPTVKPDAVMDKIVLNAGGRSICDPFMGTGSTGVAALRAGRTFVGIEHNPKHFRAAVRRITDVYHELAKGAA